jgi:hypothetical protein
VRAAAAGVAALSRKPPSTLRMAIGESSWLDVIAIVISFND